MPLILCSEWGKFCYYGNPWLFMFTDTLKNGVQLFMWDYEGRFKDCSVTHTETHEMKHSFPVCCSVVPLPVVEHAFLLLYLVQHPHGLLLLALQVYTEQHTDTHSPTTALKYKFLESYVHTTQTYVTYKDPSRQKTHKVALSSKSTTN